MTDAALADALAAAGPRPAGYKGEGITDGEWLLVAFERHCFAVAASPVAGPMPESVYHYGFLKGEIARRLDALDKP